MGGGKGGGCQTTGYRYYAGLLLIFCHKLDRLREIVVGDKTAWEGDVTSNQSIFIDAYNLFGGEAREGGIRGTVDICFGDETQPQNAYLQSVLRQDIPAYRGLFSMVLNHVMLSMNNPYIKAWGGLGTRTKTGWRDDLVDIIAADGYEDMNPVHMIRECQTNTEWGTVGLPESMIDNDSFTTAAVMLKAENFGLSFFWGKNTSVDDFIDLVKAHIDAELYLSQVTGLLTVKLIRNDYNIGALPVLDESNILELSEFKSPASTESVNQVTVNYVNRRNVPCAITVQDIAGINRTGGQVNAVTVDRVGIADPALAGRVAARILSQLASPISSATLITNRKVVTLEPGDCFAFNWAPLGISGMVMRVTQADMGELTDNRITITCARDVFSFNTLSITNPQLTEWVSPVNTPVNAVNIRISEITWWQFAREYAGESATVVSELTDTSTLVICVCGRPTKDALNYEMWDRNQGADSWIKKDVDSFPFVGTTRYQVDPEIQSTLLLQEVIDIDIVLIGTYAQLGNEMVAVTAIDATNRSVTVNRGVLDTIPVEHTAGTKIWFLQGLYGLDKEERAVGENVEVKILPSTGSGRLDISDADTSLYTCVGRMMRPYPPGNVQVNGSRWPESIGVADELSVTWSHRDRSLQTVSLTRQDVGDIGPETGVTYTLRIYGQSGTLIHTESGLTGTSYTYPAATELSDSGLEALNTALRFELESVRGSQISFNKWNITVVRMAV